MIGWLKTFSLLALWMAAVAVAQDSDGPPVRIAEAIRRALPGVDGADGWTQSIIQDVETTALGCESMTGLELPYPIEVHSVEASVGGRSVTVNVSSDGGLAQVCDAREGLISPLGPARDLDGDRLLDGEDACPHIAGLPGARRIGCPQASRGDQDGDGIFDAVDACPLQAGAAAAGGCSLFVDADGDGVPDKSDICRHDYGVIREDFAIGCPADGSGSSNMRRPAQEICAITGTLTVFDSPRADAEVLQHSGETVLEVIGRAAGGGWFQTREGWATAEGARLRGACYNIPIVNAAHGTATGCFMRPRESSVNVRQGPRGNRVAQIPPQESHAVLGRNIAGDWLFYRVGWASASVMELSGSCDRLPVLDPALVSSGTVSFCPPEYAGFLRPRIDVGSGAARVASDRLANRLRAAPQLGAEQIGEIPPRQIIDVLDGPACDGAFVWWQARWGDTVGWTVESDLKANVYYLEPGPADAPPSDSAPTAYIEPPFISSANAAKLEAIKALNIEAPKALAWSPRPSLLAALTANGILRLYEYPGYEPRADLPLPEDFHAQAIAFSRGGELAIGGLDGRIAVAVMTQDGGADISLLPESLLGAARALAWAEDKRRLAAISAGPPSQLAGLAGEVLVWDMDSPAENPQFRAAFPYHPTDIAISADGRWLAVTGESAFKDQAALWVYDLDNAALIRSRPLIAMNGQGLTRTSPAGAYGDFIYTSGDSLHAIAIDADLNMRFYHQAGRLLTHLDIRPLVMPGAEILLAIGSRNPDGSETLSLINALNRDSPLIQIRAPFDDFAFSPDGRAIALAQAPSDRVLILAFKA